VKRVLLTGGAGAIGCHVLDHLLAETDWHIAILDSFRHKGYRERLEWVFRPPENRHLPAAYWNPDDWRKRVTVHTSDLVCPISPALAERIGPVDYILHLAALSDVFYSVENPVHVIRTNIESTLTMLEYAKVTPHEAFVYFSTDEVYGPVRDGEAHAEWATHRPSNAYAASKAASEDICYAYWRAGDVRLIVTNTMNNLGELQDASKFPALVAEKVARGEVVTIHGNEREIGTRHYIHSRNVGDALLFILRNLPVTTHKRGEMDDPDRYHIVGERLSNLELAEKIAALMGKPLRYQLVDFHADNPAHDIHYGLRDTKLEPAGWRAPLTLDEGLARALG
jgi:dTDP-glucose 4,6-dehydratase